MTIDVPGGVGTERAGIPGFILQLHLPDGIEPVGEAPADLGELRDRQFMEEPWERRVDGGEALVELRVSAEPAPGALIGIIVIGYLAGQAGGPPRFLRERVELPAVPGARSRPGLASNSSWGVAKDLVQIGGPAPDAELPDLGGGRRRILDGAGPQGLLLVTYRGHW